MSDAMLRQLIQTRVGEGLLPATPCLIVWFGDGRARQCAACSRRIRGRDHSVECDHVEGPFPLHLDCYRIWHSLVGV